MAPRICALQLYHEHFIVNVHDVLASKRMFSVDLGANGDCSNEEDKDDEDRTDEDGDEAEDEVEIIPETHNRLPSVTPAKQNLKIRTRMPVLDRLFI